MNLIQISDTGELTTSQLLAQWKEKFDVWFSWFSYTDKELDRNFPAPKEPTTRYFRDTQEPDEETLGKSYNDMKEAGKLDQMMTLRERMLFELAYLEKHGEHPDIIGWTFTSSVDASGDVSDVCWFRGVRRACMGSFDPWFRDEDRGCRSAVMVTPSDSVFVPFLEIPQGVEETKDNYAVVNGVKYKMIRI